MSDIASIWHDVDPFKGGAKEAWGKNKRMYCSIIPIKKKGPKKLYNLFLDM